MAQFTWVNAERTGKLQRGFAQINVAFLRKTGRMLSVILGSQPLWRSGTAIPPMRSRGAKNQENRPGTREAYGVS